MDDEYVGWLCRHLKTLQLTVHVRGTDTAPVVELRDKKSRRVVGGIELAFRIGTLK